MFIQTLKPPVAGEDFSFCITGGSGVTRIAIHVNDRCILRFVESRRSGRAAAHMPADSAGQTLKLTATDESGNVQNLDYQIAEAKAELHSTPTRTRSKGRGNMRFRMVG